MRALQQQALADLTLARSLSPSELAARIVAPPAGDVARRWHVYQHGYQARITEALALELRAVKRIVGAEPFEALVRRYLAANVPRSFDLAHAGDRFAAFLADDELAAELPFLPDLARLERCVAEAFVAADSEPLTWSDARALGPEALLELEVRARPGTALMRSPWPLEALWRLADVADEDASVALEEAPAAVVVHRVVHAVRVRSTGWLHARLLDEALAGATSLGAVYEASAARELEETSVNDWVAAFRDLVEWEVLTTNAVPSLGAKDRSEEDAS